jgi:hypothetical protein
VRLVVDTNVLMSGSVWSGTASRLVDALLAGEATLCLSEKLVAELAEVLQRKKFGARLDERGQSATAVLTRFREVAQMFEPIEATRRRTLSTPARFPSAWCQDGPAALRTTA